MTDYSNFEKIPLSPDEMELIRKQRRPVKGVKIVMIVLSVPWIVFIAIGLFTSYFNIIIASSIPLAFFGAMSIIFTVLTAKYDRDLREGMKVNFSGSVEEKIIQHTKGSTYYYLKILGGRYEVKKDFFDNINESESVRLEIAPYSKQTLNTSKE